MGLFSDHGEETADPDKGQKFLAKNPFLALILTILLLSLVIWWFEIQWRIAKKIFHKCSKKSRREEELTLVEVTIMAIIITWAFWILVVRVFKVPMEELP